MKIGRLYPEPRKRGTGEGAQRVAVGLEGRPEARGLSEGGSSPAVRAARRRRDLRGFLKTVRSIPSIIISYNIILPISCPILEGSFSALPKPIFAAKHSLCSSVLRSTKPSTGIVNFWQMFLNVNNFGSCLQMVAELRPKSTRAFLKDCPMLSYRAGFF